MCVISKRPSYRERKKRARNFHLIPAAGGTTFKVSSTRSGSPRLVFCGVCLPQRGIAVKRDSVWLFHLMGARASHGYSCLQYSYMGKRTKRERWSVHQRCSSKSTHECAFSLLPGEYFAPPKNYFTLREAATAFLFRPRYPESYYEVYISCVVPYYGRRAKGGRGKPYWKLDPTHAFLRESGRGKVTSVKRLG